MDFHSLTRRELQFLCKRNKIPANITNLAMADALATLPNVEGLEEMMNCDVMQSPALTQARVTKTPAAISSLRKAPTASACRKLDTLMNEEEDESTMATPALASSRRRAPTASASTQRVYSTRRSVKLLQETLADLSLNEGEKSEAVKKADLLKDSKDSCDVPDVVYKVEEKDTTESDMQRPEESHYISVSDGNQDKNMDESQIHVYEISKNVETLGENGGADEVLVTDFPSELNKLEEVAKDLPTVSTGKLSLLQKTEDSAKEYNQLNASESDINMGQDGTMETDENAFSEDVLPLDLPEGIEDWDSQSGWTDEEEKDDAKVLDMKPVQEAAHISVLHGDGIIKASNEKPFDKAAQTPALPEDEIDYEFDFEVEDASDSGNLNDALLDVLVKNKTSLPDVVEFRAPIIETPTFQSQLSGDKVTDKNPPHQPLADNVMLSYQFPPPSQPTPMKYSPTKQAVDKENTENSDMEVDDKGKVNEVSNALDVNQLSMRQIKKKLKELGLNKNGGERKTAMQQGAKMVASEPEKN